MTVKNPELRLQAIQLGLDKEERKLSKKLFNAQNNKKEYKRLIDVWDGYASLGEVWKEAHRVNGARYQRKRRLWQKIYAMLLTGKPCLFLTLTFTDDALSRSDFDKRRRWVREFLKKYSPYYIANIDFGDIEKNPDSNEREHYHAIIMMDEEMSRNQFDMFCNSWRYRYLDSRKQEKLFVGNINVRKIHSGLNDAKRLANYVDKLTFHAIKDSVKNNRIIYGADSAKLLTSEIIIKIKDAIKMGEQERE